MKLLVACMMVFAAGLLPVTAALGQSPAVAKVNGVTIPQARVDAIMKDMTSQGRPDTPEVREAIKQELINREIVVQEATKRGIHKKPEVVMLLDVQRQALLVNAYLQDYVKTHPISEDALKKEYEKVKASSSGKEYKARHILVESEDEAKQIITQLKKGGSFDRIAADKSKDQGSKARGGDLDWGPAGRYVPAFGQALGKLKKGETTEAPVQTQFGWHVIRLDDERALKFPAYEDVKPQIQQEMRQQLITKAVSDLRAKAKVE
jgi:peptidyl-prolyl cis-trans isomerase C